MAAPPITERHKPHFHRVAPVKESVRAATTANITISTALNNGDSLDGITLATDDRVLVKDQSTGSQNGIYIVGASPARAYDLSTDDPSFGFLVYVREGTTNGGTIWRNTNTTLPTIDSTTLTWAQVTTGITSPSLGYFLPETYGAVGDDATDDSAAFTAMLAAMTAAGGGVALLSKKYLVPSGISTTTAHMHFWGLGNEYGPAQIRTTTANATGIAFTSSWSDSSRTFQGSVRDLLIKGAGSAASGRGIYAKSNIDVERVGIQGFYDGIYWDDLSFYSRARDCFITGCTNAAMYLNETNNITIDACRMLGDPLTVSSLDPIAYGVYIVSTFPRGEGIRIINSSIEYFTLDGIYVDGAVAPLIVSNYFETQQSSSGHAYINLGPGATKTVYAPYLGNNHFDGPGIAGFQAVKCDRVQKLTMENNDDTASFGALTVYLSSTANTTPILLINNPAYGGGTITLPANSVRLDPDNTTVVPSPTGTAAAGTSAYLARADHVHASSASGIGEIVIADVHSTPLVFADLVQTEAEDDLVYADP